MRCNTCNASGLIKFDNKLLPCPDCDAGQQHCCDGEDTCFPVYSIGIETQNICNLRTK